MTCREAFTEIYERGVWGCGSGGGSNPHIMGPYIDLVDALLLDTQPRTVLDIGCGDGKIAAAIKWSGCHYIGVDVVPMMIEECRAKGLDARLLDATTDLLPHADLVLLKEVTQHLPNAMIFALLAQLKGYAVLHTSAWDRSHNRDIQIGETRGVDLSQAPFNLDVLNVLTFKAGTTRYVSQLWRPHAD